MGKTRIEWVDKVWNPVTGCSPVSEGCRNCYAARMAQRLKGRFGYSQHDPFSPTTHYERLMEPLVWRKPSRILVCSMGDLFHELIPQRFLFDIWDTMMETPRHTYFLLTKRPQRMTEYWLKGEDHIAAGVSVENQQAADERIPVLLSIPAEIRFVSVEPCLGPVDLSKYIKGLQWVICGGETGPGARKMESDWAGELRNRCIDAGIPFFFKQMGSWHKRLSRRLDGEIWHQWPVRR